MTKVEQASNCLKACRTVVHNLGVITHRSPYICVRVTLFCKADVDCSVYDFYIKSLNRNILKKMFYFILGIYILSSDTRFMPQDRSSQNNGKIQKS